MIMINCNWLPIAVAQNTYVVRWFDGKRLALAFGLVVAFSRIGTSVNFVVSPILASSPITYEQHFYSAASCANELPQFNLGGEINTCQGGRIVDCEEMKSASETALLFYPASNTTCTMNATAIAEFTPNRCFALPAALKSAHVSGPGP